MILQTTLLAAHNKIKPPIHGNDCRSSVANLRCDQHDVTGEQNSAGIVVRVLAPIAAVANKNNENCDHPSHDEHPVLDVKTKKGKMLDKKLQRFLPPFLGQNKRFPQAGYSSKGVNYIILILSAAAGLPRE